MNLHPNWVALASIDFPRKTFIQEGQSSVKDVKARILSKDTLNGNEVKDFYLNVLSTPTTNFKHPNIISAPEKIKTAKTGKTLSDDILNTSEERRMTIFLNSAQNNNVDLVRQLLFKCPHLINSTDNYGWTGLMCAVKSNAVDVVKCLLEHKADKYLKEKSGKNAFSLAERGSLVENILLLNVTDSDKKLALSNDKRSKRVYCKVCQEYYSFENKKKHLSSTIHIFQSGKRKTVTHYGIPESNKGFQLLLKTGWNSEMGLGINGEGNKYPVKSVFKVDRYGLGNKVSKAKVTHFYANDVSAVKYRAETKRTLNKKQQDRKLIQDKISERNIRYELS